MSCSQIYRRCFVHNVNSFKASVIQSQSLDEDSNKIKLLKIRNKNKSYMPFLRSISKLKYLFNFCYNGGGDFF